MSKDYLKWYSEPTKNQIASDYYAAPAKSARKAKAPVKKLSGLKVIDINEKNKVRSLAGDSDDSGIIDLLK
jgi:hypothetical protein